MRWYKGNVTDRNKAYGIELKHAAVGDHGNWTVKIASTNNEEANTVFEVIVAKGPRDDVFEGDAYQVSSTFLSPRCLTNIPSIRVVVLTLIKMSKMRSLTWI